MTKLAPALAERFGTDLAVPVELEDNATLRTLAARGSCRRFQDRPVPMGTLRTLAAIALAAPSKSDLQQRDIVLIEDSDQRAALKALLTGQEWIAAAPHLLVFCANNRRQRQMHDWWDRAFANDHLDAFFNAAVDASIALASFVMAAEAVGLGCCPISTIRNRSTEVSALLHLPDHVFAVAAVAVGYPGCPTPRISMRLPLQTTLHRDRFSEATVQQDIQNYDVARHAHRPMTPQRHPDRFGTSDPYAWSDDKTRQYAVGERADFGAFIRAKRFDLT